MREARASMRPPQADDEPDKQPDKKQAEDKQPDKKQPDEKQADKKQPEEEGWCRLTDGRDQVADEVDPAAGLKRRASAERYAEPKRNKESREGEFKRGRQPMAEVVEHALARGQRRA